MPYETRVKEAYKLIDEIPHEKIESVIQFLQSAKNLYSTTVEEKTPVSEKKSFRQTGILKGKIWMADDFDETPECFKDYV